MRNKILFRIWLSRLIRYLIIPTALCVILLPLYDILHQQTIRGQLADASEQLAASVSVFEGYLYDIRYVTNKLFHDTAYTVMATSTDESVIDNSDTAGNASRLLEDLTYSMSPVAYSYVTFARNQLVIDGCRAYRSYSTFYPGTLEYSGMTRQEWAQQLKQDRMYCLSVRKVPLYQTAYPDSYLTVSQPFFDSNDRYMGTCSMLLREKQLIQLFLPLEEWQSSCLFYIARQDGTVLMRYRYDGDGPLENLPSAGSRVYRDQEYLFVTRELPDLEATVVIGLPYSVYAANLDTINRMIRAYIAAGLVASLVLSLAMTVVDMRYLRPMMDTLDSYEWVGSRKFYDRILQKLRSHSQLSAELERTRNQLEHVRLEALLKSGTINSPGERKLLLDTLRLEKRNYLLLIPAPDREEHNQEFRLMLTAEQVYQCYGYQPFVHNTAEGSMLVVLSLDQDTPEAFARLRSQTEALHTGLQLQQPLILSGCFTRLEQITAAYWQIRNAARSGNGGQVICLSQDADTHTSVPEISTLECLSEYLLAGYTEKAQALVEEIFSGGELSLQDFRQCFYSVRGVLLATAEKVKCEDIALLCAYDQSLPMRRQVQNLFDGCLVIGSHVDALKQSHNQRLQKDILQWLEENFSRPDLNLAMAADRFYISKKYVSQFLKDQTGKSFNEYLEELRLSHAMELLRQSDLSVTEIAVRCGFSSQNTFYKAFRRRFDVSPSALRRDGIHLND